MQHFEQHRYQAANGSHPGPVLPNRDFNVDLSSAFNAARNMTLLPPSNNETPSFTSEQYFANDTPLSQRAFDDSASIRSMRSSRSVQSMQPMTLQRPQSAQSYSSQRGFRHIPDSPLSIASLPVNVSASTNMHYRGLHQPMHHAHPPQIQRFHQPNPKQQFLSSYGGGGQNNFVPRRQGRQQTVSAHNTPKKRKPRSRSHSRGQRQRLHGQRQRAANAPRSRSRGVRSYGRPSQRSAYSKYHEDIPAEDVKSNFKVVVRCRPPLPRELQSPLGFGYVVRVDDTQKSIAISDGFCDAQISQTQPLSHNVHQFSFDYVYPETADQGQVYSTTARHSVLSTLSGYNASIIAYGQTSAGKTYTMEGFDSEQLRGIIPRAIEDIFNYIAEKASPTMRFLVRASYLQIYNEVISDLLKSDRTNLPIREDKKKGVYVSGLSEWVVRSCEEIYGLIKRGASVRATCATKLNEMSSRSHAIFIIIVEQNEIVAEQNNIKIGKLNLVDLAGSERVRISGAEGARLEESKNINQSLSALGNVISALTDNARQHIPYRDSKLTRILEDSLGGNCKTTMMAMISPALEHYSETVSTLKFANRAKNIQNIALINEDLDEKALLRKYEKELKRLKAALAEKNSNVVGKAELEKVEAQRNRAERDKMTAMQYLERISHDLEVEKHEKALLLQKLGAVTGSDYEEKLNEIETKRNCVEEDKAQVQRYKALLMKQRDIMIQLTSRLNDRDQSILALQEELDAYDNQQKIMENVLDQKTGKLKEQLSAQPQQPILFDASNEEPLNESYVNPFHSVEPRSPPPPNSKPTTVEEVKTESVDPRVAELRQELKEVHADKTSLEYLLRCRINDMVQREVDVSMKRQESELAEWRSKYENAEERRRNSEYLLELSKVGGKANVLQEQLTAILKKERSKVEERFHRKIQELKQMLLLKDQLHKSKDSDNKTVFAELKKLKNLHNKFSKFQQTLAQPNGTDGEGNGNGIMSIIKQENLSELVYDLKQLQSIETTGRSSKRQMLKQSIEQKIRLLVDNLTKKVLTQQNSNAENVKNDIIQAQQIINNSFDILN